MESYEITIPPDQKWKLKHEFADLGIVCLERVGEGDGSLFQHIFAGHIDEYRTIRRKVDVDDCIAFFTLDKYKERDGRSVAIPPFDDGIRREIVRQIAIFSFMI